MNLRTITRRESIRWIASLASATGLAAAAFVGGATASIRENVMRIIDAPETGSAAPAHPDASLFAYCSRLKAIHEEWQASIDAFNKAERAYFAAKPKQPVDSETPVDGISLVNGGVSITPEYDRIKSANARAKETWRMECGRLHEELEVDAFDTRSCEACEQWNELAMEMLSVRARTLEGINLKIDIARYAIDDGHILNAVAGDIAALGGSDDSHMGKGMTWAA